MIVMLVLGFVGSFQFVGIDRLLSRITKSDFDGNIAYYPLITALTAVLMAILLLIWQDGIEYYFSEFTIWPSGYGFSARAVWDLLIANAIIFVVMLIESITCGKIICVIR